MKEKEVKISKICIVIGRKEIELSLEEAKELKEILKEMFGEEVVKYVPNPYPVYIRKWVDWNYPRWSWTYNSNSTALGNGTTTSTYTLYLKSGSEEGDSE